MGYDGGMLLVVAAALAASDNLPTYEYTRDDAPPGEGSVSYTHWLPDHELHAAVPTTLRAAPDAPANAPPVATLVAGATVVVTEVGPEATIEGMTQIWYRVRAGAAEGWVFGAELTPLAFEADFDLDGDADVVTVAFTTDHRIRVRAGERSLDLDTAGGGYLGQKGAAVYFEELVPADKVGVPLLHLRTGVEACADFAEYWITFRTGGPTLAHRDIGLVDPPSCFSFEPAYKPGKLVMTYTKDGCADDVRPKKHKKVYRLVDGVFVK